jgi:hypothetical protein
MTHETRREDVVRSAIATYVNTRTISQIRDFFGLDHLAREMIHGLNVARQSGLEKPSIWIGKSSRGGMLIDAPRHERK